MPFFGQTTMMSADRDACKKRHRQLFDAEHRRDHVKVDEAATQVDELVSVGVEACRGVTNNDGLSAADGACEQHDVF